MKTCKKIALLVIIFLLSTTLNVYAADYATTPDGTGNEVILTPSATNVKVGDTVTIDVSGKCATGLEGVDATLEWDKTKLELTNQADLEKNTMSGVDESTGEFKLTVLVSNETPDEVELTTLSFKVLEAASVGETLSVKVSEIEIVDVNVESIEADDEEVTLTVVADDEAGDGEGEGAGSGEGEGAGDGEGEGAGDGEGEGAGDGEGEEAGDGEGEGAGDGKDEGTGDDDKKDPTIADKPINNAGLETFGLIGLVAIIIVAIVLYAKCKKYSDVK